MGPLSLRTRVGWGRRGGGCFAVSETDAPHSPTIALRTLGGIDALIALQGGVEDPVGRRRRAIKQGRRALDALDKLKLGLLRRLLDQAMLLRRKSVAADFRDGSGDEKLDHVLGEIDLRVAVELAQARGGLTPVPARGPPGVSDIPRAPLSAGRRRHHRYCHVTYPGI
jgi:Class II flagellar assembly regulator